jgi:hypothetical protein
MPDPQFNRIAVDPAAGDDHTIGLIVDQRVDGRLVARDVFPLRRGCGVRLAGGIYATFRAPDEDDLLRYFITPPIPVDPAALGISPIGVHLIERNGVWHLIDWIGAEHYPTPSAFLNEVRSMGLSRRVQRTLDFSRLTEDSRVLCVHPFANLAEPPAEIRRGPAFIASFPIHALEVVRDTHDIPATAAAAARASRSHVPVALVEV